LALTVVDHVLHAHLHAAGAGADGVRGIAHHRGGRAVTAGGPAASRSLRTGGARSLGTRALGARTRSLRTGGRGAAGLRGGLRSGRSDDGGLLLTLAGVLARVLAGSLGARLLALAGRLRGLRFVLRRSRRQTGRAARRAYDLPCAWLLAIALSSTSSLPV